MGPIIFILFIFAAPLYAAELPDQDWLAYFSPDENQIVEYRVTLVTPFGILHFNQKDKKKGAVQLDDKRYLKSVVVSDSGPWADQVSVVFTSITKKGLYERNGIRFRSNETSTFSLWSVTG